MEKKMLRALFIFALFLTFTLTLLPQDGRKFSRTVDLPTDGRITIDTYKGSIELRTWEKPMVEIIADIEPDGTGRREEEKADDTEIRIVEREKSLSIKTDYNKVRETDSWFSDLFNGGTGSLPFVHYRVTIPVGASVTIKDYKSDIRIPEIRAFADIETYKGKIDIGRIEGGARIETYKGEARIGFVRITEDSDFETYKGKIEILVPEETGFRLDAELGKRVEFHSDFDMPNKRRSRKNTDILTDLNGGGRRLSLRSEKGEIRLLKTR